MAQKTLAWILYIVILSGIALASHVPPPQGYVNDFANILDQTAEAQIGALLQGIEQETSAEIAVVTVASLEGDSIENFAVKLFEEWKIGKKNDNGLLLLIAIEDRTYKFEVGYGLESMFNDAKVGRIGREILVPYLQQNNYGEGISQTLIAIQDTLKGEEEVRYVAQKQSLSLFPIAIGVLYFIVFFFLYSRFEKKKKTKAQNTMGVLHILITIISFFISATFFVLMMFLTFILLTIGLQGRHPGSGFGGYYGGFGYGGRGGFGGFGGGMSGGGGASGRF